MSRHESMVAKTVIMLSLQDDMNSLVNDDWRERQREWYRAIWIECAELMDHYGGWKWWKHSTPDIEQSTLELVDIWHFGLSMYLEAYNDYESAAEDIVTQWQAAAGAGEFLAEVEVLASAAVERKTFSVTSVCNLMTLLDHDFDDLYRAYIGKNVLNTFRQDHGYKSGEYHKDWNGKEDNEVLVEVLTSLDSDSKTFRDELYRAHDDRYQSVVATN